MSSDNKHRKTEIIPAIMPKTFSDLSYYADTFAGLVDSVQVDIMDGEFVSETSWPYGPNGSIDEDFKSIVAKEKTFPKTDDLKFEFDLMIETPEKYIESFIQTGVNRLVFHIESIKDFDFVWENLALVRSRSTEHGKSDIEIGLALGTTTLNEDVYKHIEKIDFVQFMGIEKIGFQGQPFDDRVLDKISAFHQKFPDMLISVDGSVNMDTAPRLIEAGASRLVVGSAILKSSDIKATIKEFQNL